MLNTTDEFLHYHSIMKRSQIIQQTHIAELVYITPKTVFMPYNQCVLLKYHFEQVIPMFKTFSIYPVINKVYKLSLNKSAIQFGFTS